jgi:hypothetical protein
MIYPTFGQASQNFDDLIGLNRLFNKAFTV